MVGQNESDRGQLRVVTFPFEPFVSVNKDGHFEGLEITIVETIGNYGFIAINCMLLTACMK